MDLCKTLESIITSLPFVELEGTLMTFLKHEVAVSLVENIRLLYNACHWETMVASKFFQVRLRQAKKLLPTIPKLVWLENRSQVR